MISSCQHCGWDKESHIKKGQFSLGPTIHQVLGRRNFPLSSCPGYTPLASENTMIVTGENSIKEQKIILQEK